MACMYLVAFIGPRRASAISQRSASWPVVVPPFGFVSAPSSRCPDLRRSMLRGASPCKSQTPAEIIA